MATTETTCNSVVVNWTPPADNGSAELTQYRVLVYKRSSHLVIHRNDTTMMLSYRVSSLEPDTAYNVEVRAGNVGCFGSTSFTTEQTGLIKSHAFLYISIGSAVDGVRIIRSHNYTFTFIEYSGNKVQYMKICLHQISAPTMNFSGTTPVSVSYLNSTSVTIAINGTAGEEYRCTLNDQAINITVGQPHNQTGLAPNTSYTISCQRATNSCHETKAIFTTGNYVCT